MNLPLYIAGRYLLATKRHNAIHIISAISVCGVALAAMSMVCTLSVFNGFQEMVGGLLTTFDPTIKITPLEGTTLRTDAPELRRALSLDEVELFMPTIEENALLQYKERQAMVVVKGVEPRFEQLTAIDSILYGRGEFVLEDGVAHYVLPGMGVAAALGSGLAPVDPFTAYAPKRNVRVNMANPTAAFNRGELHSAGSVFLVNQEKYDANYVIVPLHFARTLFDYEDNEASAIEVRLKPDARVRTVQQAMRRELGSGYVVQDRHEQQADVFRIMEVEKLISYAFLTFILIIASFNVVGSLSMLMVDKRDDAAILRNLGAGQKLIMRIFLFEGWLITACGAVAGVLAGLLLCALQNWLGIVKLGTDFLVDAYPVSVHPTDVLLVLATVLAVGALAVLYPVKALAKRMPRALTPEWV